jgi:hypothetical protein
LDATNIPPAGTEIARITIADPMARSEFFEALEITSTNNMVDFEVNPIYGKNIS